MDPYDYDTSLFILKLVKELSREGATPAVDKVKMELGLERSMQLSLTQGIFSNDIYVFLTISLRMSLHCMLVPVHYRD